MNEVLTFKGVLGFFRRVLFFFLDFLGILGDVGTLKKIAVSHGNHLREVVCISTFQLSSAPLNI